MNKESMNVGGKDLKQLPIVFYDAECGLCDKLIQWVARHDRDEIMFFAPLQGETAIKYLGEPTNSSSDWTMAYLDENGRYDRSTAALRIADRIHWGYGLPSILLMIPVGLRDWVYRLVATYRYRIFGKVDACRMPSQSLRDRFLP